MLAPENPALSLQRLALQSFRLGELTLVLEGIGQVRERDQCDGCVGSEDAARDLQRLALEGLGLRFTSTLLQRRCEVEERPERVDVLGSDEPGAHRVHLAKDGLRARTLGVLEHQSEVVHRVERLLVFQAEESLRTSTTWRRSCSASHRPSERASLISLCSSSALHFPNSPSLIGSFDESSLELAAPLEDTSS